MYEIIAQIVRRAGATVLRAHDIERSVRQKTLPCDLVTEYDGAVQEQLRRELLAAFPDAGFYGEEEAEHDLAGKRAVFIVDPIDGTTNFVRHLHHSCISVGLCVDGKMEYGAVYNPYFDELFTAQRGCGAFLNGEAIRCTDADLAHSLVLFGSAIYYRETIPFTQALVCELLPDTLDFRRGGSAALDLCYLAAGRGDLFFECCLRPWDYAAGSLIAQEAGATVTALDGSPLRFVDRCSVAGGNANNYPALLERVEKIRNLEQNPSLTTLAIDSKLPEI